MPIGVVGDIHGFVELLHNIVNKTMPYDNIPAVIQVGDCGLSSEQQHRLYEHGMKFAKPTYFIDGNHEDFDILMSKTKVTEMLPNLFYCPRGTVLNIDNRVVAFMGGAASIDKQWQGTNWDARENISQHDVDHLFENLEKMGCPTVNLLVCHAPPRHVVAEHFDKDPIRRAMVRKSFGAPPDWDDPNMDVIEEIWQKLGKPDVVCGHMHRTVQFAENSIILNINQFHTV